MIIRSKAPLRISFGGGGTDVSPYLDERGGAVINSTINKYSYGTLVPRKDDLVNIKSIDLNLTARYKTSEEYSFGGKLDLLAAVINNFKPEKGLDLYLHCDAPPGSGLGSSSTVIVSLIGLFNKLNNIPFDGYKVAELAYKIERIDLGLSGGKQDQYASTFGGFNFTKFSKDSTIVESLRLDDRIVNELEYRSVLAYTGKTRLSANIIEDQKSRYMSGENTVSLDMTKELSFKMKETLLSGDIFNFAKLLDDAWQFKKDFAKNITSGYIDKLYSDAIKNGAMGGKITGAGGGGFIYLLCEFDRKHDVIDSLNKNGAIPMEFSFEKKGLQTWVSHE